jgi:SNF2 family DNA or RNA helicase
MRWDNAGGARLSELHGLLVREVMIRRLKAQVLSQLPPKRRQVRACVCVCVCVCVREGV